MRVAIDARKLTVAESGIGNYTVNLVRSFLEQATDLELLLVRSNGRGKKLFDSPMVEEVFVPFPPETPLTPLALGYFLRRQRFDVFHSPFDVTPRRLKRPLVVTIHDINWIVNPGYNSNHPVIRFAGGMFFRSALTASMDAASRIIAVSNATRNAILEYAPWHEPKLRVIPNGVDERRIFPLSKEAAFRTLANVINGANPFVLTVGQGSPYKNHFNAVRGFLQAFRDRPEYRMILVRRASGVDRALDDLLKTPQALEQVIPLPYVTSDMLNALYNRARMVLHPSYYEGFGLPLVEAMAAGVPIVTSHLSSMPEVVGPAALLVSPADPGAIARALIELDRNEALRQRLVAAGHERIALFSSAECARATLAVYREAAQG